jgi:hypothetical protein
LLEALDAGTVAGLEQVEHLLGRVQHLLGGRCAGDAVGQHREHVAGRTRARHQRDPVVLLRAVTDVLRGSRF